MKMRVRVVTFLSNIKSGSISINRNNKITFQDHAISLLTSISEQFLHIVIFQLPSIRIDFQIKWLHVEGWSGIASNCGWIIWTLKRWHNLGIPTRVTAGPSRVDWSSWHQKLAGGCTWSDSILFCFCCIIIIVPVARIDSNLRTFSCICWPIDWLEVISIQAGFNLKA